MLQDFGKGSGVSRCDLKQNLLNEGCKAAAVEFPASTLTIQKDTPLSDRASGAAEDVTQIRPQKIHMTLRPGTLIFVGHVLKICKGQKVAPIQESLI